VATNTLQISPSFTPHSHGQVAVRPSGLPASSLAIVSHRVLARHRVFTIKRSHGIRSLKVLRGTLWLTATPGGRDVLLSAGDYFILGSNAPFVIEALADAEIILHS
jgi:hypothetical protein